MLDIVLAFLLSIAQRRLRDRPIVRVDSVEPTEFEALFQAQAGEFDPLRAAPCAIAVGPRKKNQLRNARRKKAKALLIFPQTLAGFMLLGAISAGLEQTPVKLT